VELEVDGLAADKAISVLATMKLPKEGIAFFNRLAVEVERRHRDRL
jgi:hypothetical protein